MLRPILKAVYGALTAGVAAALVYVQGGGTSWLMGVLYALSTALATGGAVWGVPNAPPGQGKRDARK